MAGDIQGLDRARFEALINAPIPNPLPANAVLAVVADWCSDSQHSVMDNGYPTQMPNGQPIIYLNDHNPEAHQLLTTLPGAQNLSDHLPLNAPEAHVSGRGYSYPSFLPIHNGTIGPLLDPDVLNPTGDALPAGGLDTLQKLAVEAQGRMESANKQALNAVKDKTPTGSTIPGQARPTTSIALG